MFSGSGSALPFSSALVRSGHFQAWFEARGYQWQPDGAKNIAGATSTSYTTPATVTGTIAAATLTVNASSTCLNSSATTWTNTSLPAQPAQFTASYDATPNQNSMDGVIGLSFNAATGYASLAAITRFAATGMIDVRNAGAYSADAAVPYSAGLTYHFRLLIDPTTKTYTVYVTPQGGTELKLATSYAFRSEQSTLSTLNNWSLYADIGSQSVCNMTIGSGSTVTPPTISTQPASQTITAGQMATFVVVAAGTAPLSYQWRKNAVNIAGATSANYTTPVTATSDSGSTFTVAVSNTAGTATSAVATLTVNPAQVVPTITMPPASQTMTAGQTATFTVVAAGTAPLAYQWHKNAVNISGATSVSYTTPATTTSDSGSTFAVAVTNTAGTVTSSAATLTVNSAPVAPTITTPPASQTVTAGQTATFTAVAAGTAPLAYQWQKNAVNITGATSVSYTTPVTTTSDSGSKFTVAVNNTAGTVTSAAATLMVNPAPAPGIQVSSASLNFGSDVAGSNSTQLLIITNTGTATLTISQVNQTGSAFSVGGYTLPLNVNAGKQTTITVAFLPTSVGAATGNISIVSNALTSPTSVGLSGTGIAATLTLGISPTSLSFGNVATNTSSAPQNVTITNTGNANVTLSQITLSGSAYAMTGGSAPVTLSPSQNLIPTIRFTPTVAGSISGSISMVSNASGSPVTVSLSGTGVAPVQHSVALNWNASTSTVSGYNVYRSAVSGGPYAKINSSLVAILTYTDSTVQSGTTFYYVTTAVDSSGDESVDSNGASATIP
jgi:hypothetical protein